MGLSKDIKRLKKEMTAWRHHLHAHPEVSGGEENTAIFLEEKLKSFGLPVTHIGAHGLVASLRGKGSVSGRAIILRADTDALPIVEKTGLPYASKTPGAMHACGHDGHMAMLLGAAKYLAAHPDFDGTVHFLFQPAEETGTGAAEMIAAGLFDTFPAQAVYGLHNAPTFPLGVLGTREGDMLSAATAFTLTFTGKGGHASDPAKTTDVLAAAMETVMKLKRDYKSFIMPGDTAVLTVTAVHTSSQATNVLSDSVTVMGTIRSFDPRSQAELKAFLEKTAKPAAVAQKAKISIAYSGNFPALNNTAAETKTALSAARDVLGKFRVISKAPQTLGTEDFAYLLQKSPGNYMAMGTGSLRTAFDKSRVEGLHSAKFDFNDKALPIGTQYWVRLVKRALSPVANNGKPQPMIPPAL